MNNQRASDSLIISLYEYIDIQAGFKIFDRLSDWVLASHLFIPTAVVKVVSCV